MEDWARHSRRAWNIAIKYSGVLASETRDLAAHIDLALDEERETLRDQFAMAALQGGLANPDISCASMSAIAKNAYIQADAMLKAREGQ